jgi:hypothetical protein
MLGGNRYLAVGCGRQAIYVCFGDTCHRESDITDSDGDEPDLDRLGISQAPVQTHSPAPMSPSPPAPSMPASDSSAIRALLDANREVILACLDKPPVGLVATYAEDGSLTVSLRGEKQGSAEEQCVKAALQGLRVPATGSEGTVIHVLR